MYKDLATKDLAKVKDRQRKIINKKVTKYLCIPKYFLTFALAIQK